MFSFVRRNLEKIARYRSMAGVVKFFSQFISKGDLCFDIGAHVGEKTRAFLKLGSRVVCVEPQKQSLSRLHKSFGRNKNVVIVEKGISDKEGILDLSICREMPNVATFSKEFREESIFAKEYACCWTDSKKATVTTLDILIAQFTEPQFCKIDVEGLEEEALKGLSRLIPLISFEYNDYFFKKMEDRMSCLCALGNYKFNFTVGEPADGKGLILPQWVQRDIFLKEIYSLKKDLARMWGDIYTNLD